MERWSFGVEQICFYPSILHFKTLYYYYDSISIYLNNYSVIVMASVFCEAIQINFGIGMLPSFLPAFSGTSYSQ